MDVDSGFVEDAIELRRAARADLAAIVHLLADDVLGTRRKADAHPLPPSCACVRTGSAFFTHAWRQLLDSPGYALGDLRRAASRVDVHMYVGEHDNVHLPAFAATIAAALAGTAAVEFAALHAGTGLFAPVYAKGRCAVWTTHGAGRMACMLYFRQALEHLMASAPLEARPAAASPPRRLVVACRGRRASPDGPARLGPYSL